MRKYIELLENEKKEIDKQIRKIKQSLKNVPEGVLRITHTRGYVQYYEMKDVHNTTGKYIRKKDIELARKLAQKSYNEIMLNELINKKKAIEIFLDGYKEDDEIYNGLSNERKKLVEPLVNDDEIYRKRWEEVNYKGKEFFDDIPEIYTEKGERVRSKSEKLIADKLFMMNIPYRYEYPLKLEGVGIIYPDFTVLNVKERKEYIFEHFGMMDIPEYSENAVRKINTYAKNGIKLGDRLIITCETSENPVDMRCVEKIFKHFFM